MDVSSETISLPVEQRAKRRSPRPAVVIHVNKKKNTSCSPQMKLLILLLVLMMVACLVLLNLYLLEREKNSRISNAKVMNSTPAVESKTDKQAGAVCWTKDCIQAASGKFTVFTTSLYFICECCFRRHIHYLIIINNSTLPLF